LLEFRFDIEHQQERTQQMRTMHISPMIISFLALVALASCGDTTRERAATGALGGAVVAGPPGAVVGGAAGALTD
jgi:hypothetical protein